MSEEQVSSQACLVCRLVIGGPGGCSWLAGSGGLHLAELFEGICRANSNGLDLLGWGVNSQWPIP